MLWTKWGGSGWRVTNGTEHFHVLSRKTVIDSLVDHDERVDSKAVGNATLFEIKMAIC